MVADISILGLGISLHHFWPSELVGRHISVEAPAVGDSVNVRLEGTIRNADRGSGGVVRLGIEFDGLTESELAVAGVLGDVDQPRSRGTGAGGRRWGSGLRDSQTDRLIQEVPYAAGTVAAPDHVVV